MGSLVKHRRAGADHERFGVLLRFSGGSPPACSCTRRSTWSAFQPTADALRRRGVADPAASLAAEAGIAALRIAFERRINATNERDLPQLIRESLDQLKAVTAGRAV